jgi:hypothetical protein
VRPYPKKSLKQKELPQVVGQLPSKHDVLIFCQKKQERNTGRREGGKEIKREGRKEGRRGRRKEIQKFA